MKRDLKHINRYLDQVLSSTTFAKSPVNRELLKYLVTCSLKGENPKEFQIAADVFGKSYERDKEVNVRVYIHNLRKKLKAYYEHEGKDDELVFVLPKGHYTVDFQFSKIKSFRRQVHRHAPLLLGLSLLLLLTSLLLVFIFPKKRVDIPFWNQFLSNGYSTTLLLGDHYFYRGPIPSGQKGSIRDSKINSDLEFDSYLKAHPELIGQMKKTNLTYINNQAPLGLFYLMQVFGGGLYKLDMDYSSRSKIDDFRNRNLIFVGSFKTLHEFKSTTEKLGLKYDVESSLLSYDLADTTLQFDNRSTPYLNYEYAAVAHFMLPDERGVLFFLCDNDIGNMATLKYFTDKQLMQPIMQELKALESFNFKAIFEVKGEERTDFDITLERLDALPKNLGEIWP